MVFALDGEFCVELTDLIVWEAGVGRICVVVAVVVVNGGLVGVHDG